MSRRQSPERAIHLAILGYLRSVLIGNPLIHHSPNEFGMSGAEIARQVAKHKDLGMVPGFPDLIVLGFHGALLFEVKADTALSPAQRLVHADLERLGYRVAVVRSIDDVRERLAAWAIPTRETHTEGDLIP